MAGAVDIDPRREPWPEPLRERPPADRYCDLVLTGGVASGVVYPWAILELARHFRFRNLGGTSVGALAAALAAACEYGRRHGHDQGFEVLRRMPARLADRPDDDDACAPARTQLLALFEPAAPKSRLFGLLLESLDRFYDNSAAGQAMAADAADTSRHRSGWARLWPMRRRVAAAYGLSTALRWSLCGAAAGGFALLLWILVQGTGLGRLSEPLGWAILGGSVAAVAGLMFAAIQLWRGLRMDLRAELIDQELGFCKGAALVEWLDEGVQEAAGLSKDAPPLTFEDLWHAPLTPGGPRPAVGVGGVPVERAINLEMVTTNVTHGRPYRLPLADPDARLFFRREEWEGFLPTRVLAALWNASEPYRRKSSADPDEAWVVDPRDGHRVRRGDLRELPGARMPIVVAARLSLSYPLLFSAPPLYAIDLEHRDRATRPLRLSRFSDGGLCSNFPVHFFDSALPRWPTFGIWLERRSPHWHDQAVWLPQYAGQGRSDNWQRFEAEDTLPPDAFAEAASAGGRTGTRTTRGRRSRGGGLGTLLGFLWAGFVSAKDWRDRTAMRMPHVRRRVVRVGLRRGEGELNIAMPASMIMRMASTYGTAAGLALCKAYAPESPYANPTKAWREHLWQRLDVLQAGLHDLFRRFDIAANSAGHTVELRRLIQEAKTSAPLESLSDKRTLNQEQAEAMLHLVDTLEALQAALRDVPPLPHSPRPKPELRLRPPL